MTPRPGSERHHFPALPIGAALLGGLTGCQINTRLHRPLRPRTDALVVLGHGFPPDQRPETPDGTA